MADSPFPQEESGQEDRTQPVWNPWDGPAKPHWYSGLGFNEDTAFSGPAYRVLESFGSGAAKMELALGKLNSAVGLKHVGDAITEDASYRIKSLTPDPATTGTVAQILHGLGEGAYLVGAGSLTGVPLAGAANVGVAQGVSKYDELKEQGVTGGTALSLAGLTGVTSAAGAVLPFSYGSSLLSKVGTGAVANAVFGGANRYATHAILDANGYHDMAEQQKFWDSTQMMADLILGAGFGAISHFQDKAQGAKLAKLREEHEDAAMTANLASADQRTAPGIPTDPEAANAHSMALEKAVHQVLAGEKVDVSDTGVERARFIDRYDNNVELSEFSNWFKGSKVVDDRGFPLRMYHGTSSDFETFGPVSSKYRQAFGEAYFFSDSPEKTPSMIAGNEGGRIIPAYLNIKNPMHLEGEVFGDPRAEIKIITEAKNNGYDGIIGTNSVGEKFAVVFHSDQIKSAISDSPIQTDVFKLFEEHLREGGVLNEQQNLRDLEQLSRSSVKEAVTPKEGEAYTVQEAPLTDEQLKAFQGLRSHVPGEENVQPTAGRGNAEQGRSSNAGGRGEEGTPLRVYRGGERAVGASHFEPETLGVKTQHPSSGLGVFFTSSLEDASQYGRVSENLLDIRNPKVIPLEEMPQFDSIDEARALQAKIKAEGYDGIIIDGTGVGGPVNYVAFNPEQVLPTGEHIAPGAEPQPQMTPVEQALAARPDMTIPTEQGPMSAQEALSNVQAEVAQDNIDIPKAVRAAITCFGRFGS